MNKKLVIYGGGTVSHIRNHLALCAPAYGTTAKRLFELGKEYFPNMDICLKLTKMAGGRLETNSDVNKSVLLDIDDPSTKVIIMSAAICDFDGKIGNIESGKYSPRLKSDHEGEIKITPSFKIISQIRKDRKDIFLVGFKTTNNLDFSSMYLAGIEMGCCGN